MKTLLFCTTYAVSSPQWDARFRKWWEFFTASKLERAQILMIDDGSPVLPAWRGVKVLSDLTDRQPPEKTVLYHFADNLGRSDALVYPGWFRSFTFAAVYAHRYGFDKVVHVESDSFLFTERIIAYINGLTSGWTALWCPRWEMPETCVQIIAADQLELYRQFSTVSYATELAGQRIEDRLPFTHVNKDFIGDRYGEYLDWVPEDADFACNIPDEWPV